MEITNAQRIRSMTDEELAAFLLFFVPTTFDRAMYTGISGEYTKAAEETIKNNLDWLKRAVKNENIDEMWSECEAIGTAGQDRRVNRMSNDLISRKEAINKIVQDCQIYEVDGKLFYDAREVDRILNNIPMDFNNGSNKY